MVGEEKVGEEREGKGRWALILISVWVRYSWPEVAGRAECIVQTAEILLHRVQTNAKSSDDAEECHGKLTRIPFWQLPLRILLAFVELYGVFFIFGQCLRSHSYSQTNHARTMYSVSVLEICIFDLILVLA